MRCLNPKVRLLVVPGLHDSGPTHWQTLLQQQHRSARRVQQTDWHTPDIERWAERIAQTLAQEPPGPWVAVAHSFGCLALAHWLRHGGHGVASAVLVAPADPLKFHLGGTLRCEPLPITSSVLVASRTDPWMPFGSAVNWARAWGCQLVDLGDAGHINVDSGHGRWPLGEQIVERHIQRAHRLNRLEHAHATELTFAV